MCEGGPLIDATAGEGRLVGCSGIAVCEYVLYEIVAVRVIDIIQQTRSTATDANGTKQILRRATDRPLQYTQPMADPHPTAAQHGRSECAAVAVAAVGKWHSTLSTT